jgi:hypothetical protein
MAAKRTRVARFRTQAEMDEQGRTAPSSKIILPQPAAGLRDLNPLREAVISIESPYCHW